MGDFAKAEIARFVVFVDVDDRGGDKLATRLAGYFDGHRGHPGDEDPDDERGGWTPWVIDQANAVCDRIAEAVIERLKWSLPTDAKGDICLPGAAKYAVHPDGGVYRVRPTFMQCNGKVTGWYRMDPPQHEKWSVRWRPDQVFENRGDAQASRHKAARGGGGCLR